MVVGTINTGRRDGNTHWLANTVDQWSSGRTPYSGILGNGALVRSISSGLQKTNKTAVAPYMATGLSEMCAEYKCIG